MLKTATAVSKRILIHLALKYAAELVVRNVIAAAERAAARTSNTLDDQLVEKLKAEQETIIGMINEGVRNR